MDEHSIDGVIAAEQRRGAALVAGDFAALRGMISPAITHTHTRGVTDDHGSYFDFIEHRLAFLGAERGPLSVRLFGGVAVMAGEMRNRVLPTGGAEPVLTRAQVLQVWVWRGGRWILEAFQSTALPADRP